MSEGMFKYNDMLSSLYDMFCHLPMENRAEAMILLIVLQERQQTFIRENIAFGDEEGSSVEKRAECAPIEIDISDSEDSNSSHVSELSPIQDGGDTAEHDSMQISITPDQIHHEACNEAQLVISEISSETSSVQPGIPSNVQIIAPEHAGSAISCEPAHVQPEGHSNTQSITPGSPSPIQTENQVHQDILNNYILISPYGPQPWEEESDSEHNQSEGEVPPVKDETSKSKEGLVRYMRKRRHVPTSPTKSKEGRVNRTTKSKEVWVKPKKTLPVLCIGLQETSAVAIEQLPVAVPKPHFNGVPILATSKTTVIIIDLKTTDLFLNEVYPHITQISAVSMDNQHNHFSRYVKPQIPISEDAQKVTGIRVESTPQWTEMTYCGQIVEFHNIRSVVPDFLEWIKSVGPAPRLLASHDGRTFVFHVLTPALEAIGHLPQFLESVSGVLDTKQLCQVKYPKRASYKQQDLVKDLLQTTLYNAHNAFDNMIALAKLVKHINPTPLELSKVSFSSSSIFEQLNYNREIKKNIRSFDVLIQREIMSHTTAERVAGSGLNIQHLQAIYNHKGMDGLQDTFQAIKQTGRSIVTSREQVLPRLAKYFDYLQSSIL